LAGKIRLQAHRGKRSDLAEDPYPLGDFSVSRVNREAAANMIDDEAQLIRLAQQGDVAACTELYDRHYDAVYRYCYCRVSDVGLAQDLTSEVFVRMVDKLDTFKVRGRPLLAWLYTIARNLITDVHRRNGKVMHLPLDSASLLVASDQGDPILSVERRIQAECLAAALRHLTEEQRQVILLKFMEDYRNCHVARILNKSEGAVKSLQHRALSALRRALEKERCYEA
jgi:RNA polymerase sigma-70 factor (ECF subfamily)